MKSAESTRARIRASATLAAAALALCACGSTPTDEPLAAAQKSWLGATYDQVLMAWGAPSQSSVDSHTWLTSDKIYSVPSGGGAGGVMFPAARCDRTLAFRDGRVVDGRWIGDPEFCRRYARK